MTRHRTWKRLTPALSGEPAAPVIVEAADADAIDVAHRGCLLCASGTDHVLSVARSQGT